MRQKKYHTKPRPAAIQFNRNGKYELIDEKSLPKQITWKLWGATGATRVAVYFSYPGKMFKCVRHKATGKTVYYRLITEWSPVNKLRVDTEPKRERNTRYRVGGFAWFIGFNGLWYTITFVRRVRNKLTIRPVGKLDADKICEWPYADEIEFSANRANAYYTRLRPLHARKI